VISAGDLTERVTYREPSTATDTFGQAEVIDWPARWTAWASVKGQGTREFFRARQLVADADWVVTLRGPRVIRPSGRFTWQDHMGDVHTAQLAGAAGDVANNGAELVLILKEQPKQK